MATRKPAFITKDIIGRKVIPTRPYKWGPGVPSKAIEFEELPLSIKPSIAEQDPLAGISALGTQDLFAITTQDGAYIEITPTIA